jgi:hypothetical protein
MSWEALRLTSRSPSECLTVLGPHGVDELIRDARADCWREYPPDDRTVANVKRVFTEVFDRNLRHWRSIKKPTPAAFFENLLPHPADGHIRQALVLCYMMLPRGKKSVSIVADVVTQIFQRSLDAWDADYATFTKGPKASKRPSKRVAAPTRKPARLSKNKKKTSSK